MFEVVYINYDITYEEKNAVSTPMEDLANIRQRIVREYKRRDKSLLQRQIVTEGLQRKVQNTVERGIWRLREIFTIE